MRPAPLIAFVLSALVTASARAGMPSFSFNDLAEARLEAISFFLLVFLVCALVVRWAWNSLAEVVTTLPPIRFKHALCLVLLASLLLYVVLGLIAGARELLTPGAWEKEGLTYQLAVTDLDGTPPADSAREDALQRLHLALLSYAESHAGAFPPNPETSGFDTAIWNGNGEDDRRFSYIGWLGTSSQSDRIVAYENDPELDNPMVLTVGGTVHAMNPRALDARLRRELDDVIDRVQSRTDDGQ